MARETKVGLVTGLAFIICFAVILANRGAKTPTSHVPYRVDRGVNTVSQGTGGQSKPNSNSPQRIAGNQPASTRAATPQQIQRGPRVTAQQPNRSRTEPESGSAGVTVPFRPESAVRQGDLGTRASVARGQSESAAPSTPRNPMATGTEVALTSPMTDDGDQRRRQLQDALNARLRNGESNDPSNDRTRPTVTSRDDNFAGGPTGTRTPAKRQESSTRIASRYTVKSGDSLSRIAANHYGRATNDNTRSLFEANRDVLQSPDRVKIGTELKIPRLTPESATPASVRRDQSQTLASSVAVEPAKAPPSAPIEWYQIKKSDRYSSIAREQLGDASRWPEIYELNRDKFPDPQLIREGVRIKLPAARAAVTTEQRR